MKTFQKLLSVLLAACLLACCASPALADGALFSDPDSAAAFIRAGMVRRDTTIDFLYEAPIAKVGAVTAENLTAYYTRQLKEIQEKVFAHTGKGNEGDYLRTHLVSSPIGVIGNGDGYYSDDETSLIYPGSFTASFYTTAEQESRVSSAIVSAMKELDLFNKSDYEKVRAIHDYICARVSYDKKNENNSAYKLKYSAYAALINGKTVCQGYASLFYRMALEADVDCRIISGKANNGSITGDHSWNIVKVNGKYYNLDVTWDDESGSDKYFLVGKDGFGDHYPFDEYNSKSFNAKYPIAEKTFQPGDPGSLACGGKHQIVIDKAVPPTCTSDGKTAGTHCAVCGTVLKPQTTVKATGHKWNGVVTKPATPTAEGLMTFTCSVCHMTKTESIPKQSQPGQTDQPGTTDTPGKTDRPGSRGDVDGDGVVTSGDARLALRASVQLENYAAGSAPFAAADVDGNGVIEAGDARTILRVSVKLEFFA